MRVFVCEKMLDLLWGCSLLEASKVEKRVRGSEICFGVDKNA